LKFFTRRQMRSIHKGMQARQQRAQRLGNQESSPSPGRTPVVQLLSGNLDRLLIVASLVHPNFKPGLIDRLLVLAEQENLEAVLAEFSACRCRYRDCLHQHEPGCSVREACDQGLVDPQRYASYLRILRSL
jgi:putative ribosome biogenesis GTPase RsgA